MRIAKKFVIGGLLMTLLLGVSACGGSGGGGADDDDSKNPKNEWDDMRWDRGVWGLVVDVGCKIS